MLSINDEDYDDIAFFDKMPGSDPMYWGRKALIIKGEIKSPKAVDVVKEYKI